MIKASEARHLYDESLQDWKNGDAEQSFVNILITNRAGQGSKFPVIL